VLQHWLCFDAAAQPIYVAMQYGAREVAAMTKTPEIRFRRTRQFIDAVRETFEEASRLRAEARRKWPSADY
jgi:hypothetical protein